MLSGECFGQPHRVPVFTLLLLGDLFEGFQLLSMNDKKGENRWIRYSPEKRKLRINDDRQFILPRLF